MELTKKHIESMGGFSEELPELVTTILTVVPSNVPKKLALGIVLSELSTFISSFRNNITLNTDSSKMQTFVPTNMFTFILSPSGISKDRTRNLIASLFAGGYDILDKHKDDEAVRKAKVMSIAETKDDKSYFSYMETPLDNDFKFGTSAGASDTISCIGNNQSYGVPYLLSSEIGADLATRGEELTKTFTVLSDLYDLGTAKFDTIKSKEGRIKPVKNLPVNFLVFGSEQGILQDSANKKKFRSFFSQQLARRCLFSFTRYIKEETVPDTIAGREAARVKSQATSGANYDVLYDLFTDIGNWIPTNGVITIDRDVDVLKDHYEFYNQEAAKLISDTLPISKLSRMHKQWIALKLSGIFALCRGEVNIEVQDYIDALNTVEYLAKDLEEFEKELDKEPFELFYSYCKNNSIDGKLELGITELKKLNFVEGRSGAKAKMQELVLLLNDYSDDSIFTVVDSKIVYEELTASAGVGVSILGIDTTDLEKAVESSQPKEVISRLKKEIATKTAYGYTYVDTEEDGSPLAFSSLSDMLSMSYAYSPFKLKEKGTAKYNTDLHTNPVGGIRGKDNIDSGTKIVVLDVDTSTITDKEAHLMLSGINHHIVRTSDKDNPFKFRVILEMDMVVSLPAIQWKIFVEKLSTSLGIISDPVPQSQIFYSYEDRTVLSEVDGEPIKVKEFIVEANELADSKANAKKLSKSEVRQALDNPRATFSYAYEHPTYTGLSSKIMRAAYHARDLGLDSEQVLELVDDINSYVYSCIGECLEEERIESTIRVQISRWQ